MCDNRGCSLTAEYQVTDATEVSKDVCQKCYDNEGWDKAPANQVKVLTEDNEFSGVFTRIHGKLIWYYNERAAKALGELLEKYKTWTALAKAMGTSEPTLSKYRKKMKDEGYDIPTKGRVTKPQRDLMAEVVEKTKNQDPPVLQDAQKLSRELIQLAEKRRERAQAVVERTTRAIELLTECEDLLKDEE